MNNAVFKSFENSEFADNREFLRLALSRVDYTDNRKNQNHYFADSADYPAEDGNSADNADYQTGYEEHKTLIGMEFGEF